MATTVVTGRDCTVSFTNDSGVDIDAQALSATLTKTVDRQRYETLDGPAYKTTSASGTFEMTVLADWGKANSVCEYVWGLMDQAPDTPRAISFTAASGATFAFDAYLDYPTAGGTAPDAQEVTFTFTIAGDADVTETFS
jgi:hypothetical protein